MEASSPPVSTVVDFGHFLGIALPFCFFALFPMHGVCFKAGDAFVNPEITAERVLRTSLGCIRCFVFKASLTFCGRLGLLNEFVRYFLYRPRIDFLFIQSKANQSEKPRDKNA